MYTQCPDCQTRFRVTAAVLRAAHGTVRCGRCGSAFDALERLSDTPEAPPEPVLEPLVITAAPLAYPALESAGLEEAAQGSDEVLVDESRTTETITLEGERVSVDVEPEVPEPEVASQPVVEPPLEIELEDDLDATDRYEILQIAESEFPDEREAERELEALVQRLQREFGAEFAESDAELELGEHPATASDLGEPATPELARDEPIFVDVTPNGAVTSVPRPPAAFELEPEPRIGPIAVPETVAAEPPAPAPRPVEPVRAGGARVAPARVGPMAPAAAASRVEELPLSTRRIRPAPEEVEVEAEPEARRSAWSTLAWTAGSALLVLVLAAQVVHHWRDTLARDARIGGPLRAAYGRLGLAPPSSREVAAMELRQLGVDERDAGRMVVRASITNRAAFAQPLPVLRLQLEDRFGSMIAVRDFESTDYLPAAAPAAAMLAPGATSEAELVLVDPGPDAVGYRLDVCLRDDAGQLLCAQPGPG